MLSTRAEAKFFHHLQLGDVVFHSQAYRGITRTNHHTDAYAQGGDTRYQQTEVFFMIVQDVDSKQAIFATCIFKCSVSSQLTLID